MEQDFEKKEPEEIEEPKKKQSKAITAVKVILTAVILVFAGIGIGRTAAGILVGGSPALFSGSAEEQKMKILERLIDKYYLYSDEIDEDEVSEGKYKGYVNALGDKYTEYYDEEETTALFEATSGEFSGIGVVVSQNRETGVVEIMNVYEESPAERAGIKAGDIIAEVDGTDVTREGLSEVVSRVKGDQGTDVEIGVLRDGEMLKLTATRDIIEAHTVESRMEEDGIGYISVSEFDSVTYKQFKNALEDLESQGLEGLVIDLRNNPGGNVDTVTDMLKLILPEGVIMSAKDKNGNTEEISGNGSSEFMKPLAVLVNGNSASASEIFSGAIQDYEKGTIVGTQTYGKGVMQQIIKLGDGTSLKVTVAEYYLPSGRSINGTGVTPDVEIGYEYDEENPDADNQLAKAVEVVRNKILAK